MFLKIRIYLRSTGETPSSSPNENINKFLEVCSIPKEITYDDKVKRVAEKFVPEPLYLLQSSIVGEKQPYIRTS